MKPPTDKQLLAYGTQYPPDADYACSYCGRVDRGYYVQPVHPFWAGEAGKFSCTECRNRDNDRRRTERKRQLAAEPRCEVAGCRRRGALRVARCVLLCQAHYKRAQSGLERSAAAFGAMALFMPQYYDKLDILRWAAEK